MVRKVKSGLVRRLENAIIYKSTVLNLGGNSLDEVPPQVFEMQDKTTYMFAHVWQGKATIPQLIQSLRFLQNQ